MLRAIVLSLHGQLTYVLFAGLLNASSLVVLQSFLAYEQTISHGTSHHAGVYRSWESCQHFGSVAALKEGLKQPPVLIWPLDRASCSAVFRYMATWMFDRFVSEHRTKSIACRL